MRLDSPLLLARCRKWLQQLSIWTKQYWQRALLIGLVTFIVLKKDVAIDLELSGAVSQADWPALSDWIPTPPVRSTQAEEATPMNTSLLGDPAAQTAALDAPRRQDRRRSAASLGIGDWSFLKEESGRKRAEKRARQLQYVDRYVDIARREMDEFGIPASITLAQGLLESDAGKSRLATQNNNHFGIKCFSKTCKKGHCRNFSDDHHKDFFRVYDSAEESYSAHSHLLLADRYRDLFNLASNDYIGWAFGLKKAGYATDKHYAEKLIYLIEDLELYRYDL